MIGLVLRWVFRLGFIAVIARQARAQQARRTVPPGTVPFPGMPRAPQLPHIDTQQVTRVARAAGHTAAAVTLSVAALLLAVAFFTLLLTGGPGFLIVGAGVLLAVSVLAAAYQVRTLVRAGRTRLPAVR